jgi:hypothetical protein
MEEKKHLSCLSCKEAFVLPIILQDRNDSVWQENILYRKIPDKMYGWNHSINISHFVILSIWLTESLMSVNDETVRRKIDKEFLNGRTKLSTRVSLTEWRQLDLVCPWYDGIYISQHHIIKHSCWEVESDCDRALVVCMI